MTVVIGKRYDGAMHGKNEGPGVTSNRRRSPARARMVRSAATLMRERGIHGVGLREIVTHSGGPRGSLGRYFPGGKTQLMTEAIDVALAGLFDELDRALTDSETFPDAIGVIVAPWRRLLVDQVLDADDARDTHSVACLLGYGADAICPRLALQSVAADADASEEGGAVSAAAQENYQAAVEDGVLKIMSKMGISTVDSYRGAQIFEIVGLAPEVVGTSFAGTPSPVGGLGWDEQFFRVRGCNHR